MNFGPHDSKLLNLWQRLQFRSESNESLPSDKADCIREQLVQLNNLVLSGKISSQRYSRLFNQYAAKYCKIVDGQDLTEGLNNFAEPVLSLVTGHRNESQSWKSSLSVESVENNTIWETLKNMGESKGIETKSTITCTSTAVARSGSLENSSSTGFNQVKGLEVQRTDHTNTRNTTTRITSKLTQIGSGIEQKPHGRGQYLPDESKMDKDDSRNQPSVQEVRGCYGGYPRPNAIQEEYFRIPKKMTAPYPEGSSCYDGTSAPERSVHEGVFQHEGHGMKRDGQQFWMDGSRNSKTNRTADPRGVQAYGWGYPMQHQDCAGDHMHSKPHHVHQPHANNYDNEDEDSGPPSFITAKQQYIIDCKTKNRRGGGRSGANGGGYGKQGPVGYGGGRKTLGTRRGPSSRFVPPILNRDGDENMTERRSYEKDGSTGCKSDSNKGESITGDPELDERLKNIDPKMVELIMNEIMDHGPPIAWDDIAGLEFAKNVIKEIVVWPMLRPDIFKGLRGPPKGLLLFGPPGTGKTLIGKCIASQSKATFFSISASSLTSKWVGEGEKMVRALFAVARCYLPAVIFMDEIDSLLTQRTDGEHEASRRIKTEFFVQLDGATTNCDERLLVVGATNRPQEIDEAARRRLVKRLYIPLPDESARRQIIQNLLAQQNYTLADQQVHDIVLRSKGYSGADMSNLCREAALGPIRSIGSADIQHITADQVRPIQFQDFDAAFSQVRASVSQRDLDIYIEWNRLFGSGSK